MRRFLAVLTGVVFAALFYVSQEVEAVKLGYTISKQEETRTLFLDRARALKYNIARLKAPNTLEKRLVAQKINLQAPRSWQTLIISPASAGTQAAARSRLDPGPYFTKFLIGTAQAEAKES